MHRMLYVLLLLAVAGCQTVRSGLGAAQSAIDKGVGVNIPTEQSAAAAPKAPDPARPDLPGGLVGDTEHRAYSGTTPQR